VSDPPNVIPRDRWLCGHAHAATEAIASKTAEVGGLKLHYLTSGHGPGCGRPIIPLLADKFTVIAPDLPGIGDSDQKMG